MYYFKTLDRSFTKLLGNSKRSHFENTTQNCQFLMLSQHTLLTKVYFSLIHITHLVFFTYIQSFLRCNKSKFLNFWVVFNNFVSTDSPPRQCKHYSKECGQSLHTLFKSSFSLNYNSPQTI